MVHWLTGYRCLDNFNISWARTQSLLTFGCSWRSASSQQASSSLSSLSSLSSCRAEWEAASPQLPPTAQPWNYLHAHIWRSSVIMFRWPFFNRCTCKTECTVVQGTTVDPWQYQGQDTRVLHMRGKGQDTFPAPYMAANKTLKRCSGWFLPGTIKTAFVI